MPLNKTPVYRNLGTRVTFLYLEYEDLIAVLLIAPVAFFLGSLFDRELFGIPMKLVFQWGIPATTVVLLLTFKYGNPLRANPMHVDYTAEISLPLAGVP